MSKTNLKQNLGEKVKAVLIAFKTSCAMLYLLKNFVLSFKTLTINKLQNKQNSKSTCFAFSFECCK